MGNEAILSPLSESQYAGYLKEVGHSVIEHQGRFWKSHPAGFFHSVHLLARMKKQEATRPAKVCWGFRTSLCEADASHANGTLPVHILSDLQNYDLSSLRQKRRTTLRKCWKLAEIIEVREPDLLLDQGYPVVTSDHERHKYGRLLSREEFRNLIERYFKWNFVVLAGVQEGKLAAFAAVSAIGQTAYIEDLKVHSDFLDCNLASGLTYQMAQVCKRSTEISELAHGLHARENQSLCFLKEDLGFKVCRLPSRVWFAPFCAEFVRHRRPHAYYRLCGHD